MDHLDKWTECHLLSLPKAIRLEIWKHVLTDVSMPELHVGIFREPSSPYLRHPQPPAPKINVSLRRNTPINVNLLQVNQFIYEEALPILYSNAKFAPWDLEGLLPQFLDMLSPSARSCVRHIKLYLPESTTSPTARLDPSRPFFNWAITCAQVAKLNGTLQQLEIEGDWSIFADKARQRSILAPLLKITAAKTFTPRPNPSPTSLSDHALEFQTLLAQVDQHLKANAQVRKQRTEAEALERAARPERARLAQEAAAEASQTQQQEEEQSSKSGREMAEWRRFAEANIKQMTEMGLDSDASWEGDESTTAADWDLVSVRSGASTPKARSATGADVAAFTLVGKQGVGKNGDESDAESESWEKL